MLVHYSSAELHNPVSHSLLCPSRVALSFVVVVALRLCSPSTMARISGYAATLPRTVRPSVVSLSSTTPWFEHMRIEVISCLVAFST